MQNGSRLPTHLASAVFKIATTSLHEMTRGSLARAFPVALLRKKKHLTIHEVSVRTPDLTILEAVRSCAKPNFRKHGTTASMLATKLGQSLISLLVPFFLFGFLFRFVLRLALPRRRRRTWGDVVIPDLHRRCPFSL